MTQLQSTAPDSLNRRLEGLSRLLDVTRSLALKIDLTSILQVVATDVCQALDCERASVYQYDPARDELYTRVTTELEIAEIRTGLEQGITGSVARSRRIANVSDPALDPRWNSAIDKETGFHTRNILAAPLISLTDGALLGVLQLLNKRGGDFDGLDEDLLLAFSHHAAATMDRARLIKQLEQKQAVEASLNLAREIQRGFMPRQLLTIPGYSAASWWYPNEAVGGDYCDLVPLLDGRVGLVMADVSGHGLGPALIMASVRATLRALILEHDAPETLLGLLGRSLSGDLQEGRFITLVLAALDPVTHTLEYSNAGHSPALHYRAATQQFGSLASTGVPLGVLDWPEYPPGPPVQLDAGDMIVLCTDGIVEAPNLDGELFGLPRLKEIIRGLADRPLEDLVRGVGQAVEEHYVGDAPPDDLTILAVRRNE